MHEIHSKSELYFERTTSFDLSDRVKQLDLFDQQLGTSRTPFLTLIRVTEAGSQSIRDSHSRHAKKKHTHRLRVQVEPFKCTLRDAMETMSDEQYIAVGRAVLSALCKAHVLRYYNLRLSLDNIVLLHTQDDAVWTGTRRGSVNLSNVHDVRVFPNPLIWRHPSDADWNSINATHDLDYFCMLMMGLDRKTSARMVSDWILSGTRHPGALAMRVVANQIWHHSEMRAGFLHEFLMYEVENARRELNV